MTEALWRAVDAITKPTTMRIARDDVAPLQFHRQEAATAASRSHGEVPSLWEQAEMALTTGSESSGGKPSPLATRSPADLTLMETMADIREAVEYNLTMRHHQPKTTVPLSIRHLASLAILEGVDTADWWRMRFEQWARVLAVYLKAVETGPRPMRLRARCPVCRCEFITVEQDGERVQARPILAVYRDGWFRCFECQACTATWWSGAQVYDLHAAIDADGTNHSTCPQRLEA